MSPFTPFTPSRQFSTFFIRCLKPSNQCTQEGGVFDNEYLILPYPLRLPSPLAPPTSSASIVEVSWVDGNGFTSVAWPCDLWIDGCRASGAFTWVVWTNPSPQPFDISGIFTTFIILTTVDLSDGLEMNVVPVLWASYVDYRGCDGIEFHDL